MIEKLSRVRDELDQMIREMEEGGAAALSVGSADTSPCAGEARAESEAALQNEQILHLTVKEVNDLVRQVAQTNADFINSQRQYTEALANPKAYWPVTLTHNDIKEGDGDA